MIRTSILSLAGALAFGLACFVFANDASAQCCNSYGNYGYNNCGYNNCGGCYNNCHRRIVLRPRCHNHCGYNRCGYNNHCGTSYNHCGTSYNNCGTYNHCGTSYNNCGSCGYANYTPSYRGYASTGCNSCGTYTSYTPSYNHCGCNPCGNYGGNYYGGHVISSGCQGCAGTVTEGAITPQAEPVPVDNATPQAGGDVATPPTPDDT